MQIKDIIGENWANNAHMGAGSERAQDQRLLEKQPKRRRSKVREGLLPVQPVLAAIRMFNRKREAYELFTRPFASAEEATAWVNKNNAELHSLTPAKPTAPPQSPADLQNMTQQIQTARKIGDSR